MTKTAQSPRKVFYGTSAGTTGPFSFVDDAGVAVTVQSQSHLTLTRYKTIASTDGTVESGWSVSGLPDTPVITLSTALTSGQVLVVQRLQPIRQQTQFPSTGDYRSEDIEAALDEAAEQRQELAARLARLEAGAGDGVEPVGSFLSRFGLTQDGNPKGLFAGWDANGEPAVLTVPGSNTVLTGSLSALIGQSNAASSDENAKGGDLTSVPGVFLWQVDQWIVWEPAEAWRSEPSGGSRAGQNNALFQEAKARYLESVKAGQPVTEYCIVDARGGRPISDWVSGSKERYVSFKSQVEAALASPEMVALGITQLTRMRMWQGEADSSNGNYDRDIDTLVSQLVAETWYSDDTPLIGVELAPKFNQARYWRNASANANFLVTSVSSDGVNFPDNTHADADGLTKIGFRWKRLDSGGASTLPVDSRILSPLNDETDVTFSVGPGERFETLREAFDWLNDQSLVGVKLITLRLTPGEHDCTDTGYFHGNMPITIRGWSDATLPDEATFGNTPESARAAIEANWDTRIVCSGGDQTGLSLGAQRIDLLYLGVIANGTGALVGIEVNGSASIRDCAVHGFADDGIKVTEEATCDLQDVVVYGGDTGLNNRGHIYASITNNRKLMFLGQSGNSVVLTNRSSTGYLPVVSVRNFLGDHPIFAQNGASGYFAGIETDVVRGLVRAADGSVSIGSVVCPEINANGNNSTFYAQNGGKIHIRAAVNIPLSSGRLVFARGPSTVAFNSTVTVDTWNSGGELMRAQLPGSQIIMDAFTVNGGTGHGSNDIRADSGGIIQTNGITVPAGLGISDRNTPNAAKFGSVVWG